MAIKVTEQLDENSIALLTYLYPLIEKSLSQSNNIAKLNKAIDEIMMVNQEMLSSSIPCQNFVTTAKCRKDFFNALNITEADVVNALRQSTYIQKSWERANNPLYVSTILVMRYFVVHKKQDMLEKTTKLMLCFMYSSAFSGRFPKAKPNENVMKFTINRLKYKSDIKKLGSVMAVINKKSLVFLNGERDDDASNPDKTSKYDLLTKATDKIITNLLQDMYDRIKHFLINIAEEYYRDYKEGNYINTDVDVNDDDNFMESDNVSFMVEKTTQKIMSRISLTGYPNANTIKVTMAYINDSSCKEMHLRNLLNTIYDDNNLKEFEVMIRNILQIFLFDYKKQIEDIKSRDFVIIMATHYKKQTSQDKNLNTLKNQLNMFVNNSPITKKVTRQASLNLYKKALLFYTVLIIQHYA